MPTVSRPTGGGPGVPSSVQRYSILPFGSRSDAVKFCLKVSDALESAVLAGDGASGATLWLAAAVAQPGAVNVYACDRALMGAHAAGLEVELIGHVTAADLPLARCLVIGDSRLLER